MIQTNADALITLHALLLLLLRRRRRRRLGLH
jgi:hypothetical protein